MRTFGIICIVLGGLNLLVGFAGLSTEYAEQASSKFGFGISALVLGLFLLSRAKKKKEEEEAKNRWKNE